MLFRERFPEAAWCLRKPASRPARYICVCVLAITLILAITVRVEGALFERRVIATLRALSTLQVGVTSTTEVVTRMRALGFVTRRYGPPVCFDEECISTVIPNSHLSNAAFLPVVQTESPALYSALTRLGFHFSNLSVEVRFTSGKVSFFSYELMLSTSRFDFGADAIVVGVTSQEKLLGRSEGAPYRITTSGAWPDKIVRIGLTPNTSPELVNCAFDLRLHCLWSLTACRTWREVLPHVRPN
jgi:hypothetical protein